MDWLIFIIIVFIVKLIVLAFCYCYRAQLRNRANSRLLREDIEIQRSGTNAMNFVNNGQQSRVYSVSNSNNQYPTDDFEHVQSFEPPTAPSSDRFYDPPPSYWATVNEDENTSSQIRPCLFTPTRLN